MQSQELVRTAPIGELARRSYAREQIELIKQTVAEGATDAELDLFLELAARYELDPFAGHIWCARMRGENGSAGRMVVLIGRDGMLVLARRSPDFKGIRGNVVHENDHFEVEEGETIKVKHKIGHPKERGEIVGAWALVSREGQTPIYFFANLDEYMPTHSKVDRTPWGKHRSAMILKCAQSTALRFAFSITGLIGAEEISSRLADSKLAEHDAEAATGEIEWGDDPEVAQRLAELFAAANATVEHSYRPRKIQAMLAGKTEGEHRQVILDLERFIEQNGGTVPEPRPLDNTVDEPEIEEADWQQVEEERVEAKCGRTDLDPHRPHHWRRRPDGSYGEYDDEGEMVWCPGEERSDQEKLPGT